MVFIVTTTINSSFRSNGGNILTCIASYAATTTGAALLRSFWFGVAFTVVPFNLSSSTQIFFGDINTLEEIRIQTFEPFQGMTIPVRR